MKQTIATVKGQVYRLQFWQGWCVRTNVVGLGDEHLLAQKGRSNFNFNIRSLNIR